MTDPKEARVSAHWDAYWEAQARTGFISAPAEPWEALCACVDVAGLQVLDLATGTGGTAARLATAGARVTAVDLSPRSLQVAQDTARRQSVTVRFLCADVLRLPLPDQAFDLVVSLSVMHYFHRPQPFLAEVNRVLRPGGWALIEVPQKYSPFTLYKRWCMARGHWEYGDWETEYSIEELKTIVRQSGFVPMRSYAREYFPYAYYALRHLQRIEGRLGRRFLPSGLWRHYEAFWRRLERGWWGLHTLRDVGIVAQKPGD